MPSYTDKFPSKLLRAADLNGRRARATIAKVDSQTFGRGADATQKLVLIFRELTIKPMALNITNARRIARVAGSDDVDCWAGVSIVLTPSETEFGGKTVPCVRVLDEPASDAPLASRDRQLDVDDDFDNRETLGDL